MKRVLFLLTMVFALSSCSTYYYQLYDVANSSLKQQNDQFVSENEDCAITYNFWGNCGNASVVFHNKTDKNLFVSLTQSSFIFNGISTPFFTDMEKHIVLSNVESRTYRQLPVICVAPHASVVVGDFNIIEKAYRFCERDKDFPARTYSENYSCDNSPITFGYHISYSSNQDCVLTQGFDSNFYVSKIEVMKSKYATEKIEVKEDCYQEWTHSEKRLKNYSPKKFFTSTEKSINM
jgi:hypothetical protein|nr:MAG TPA: Prokaryotic membrane lipoprotein lipid attachment site [Caudoviricetes sp.]